jgi:hypothetical protein
VRVPSLFFLAIVGAGSTGAADDAPPPPAQVVLRIDAPDPVGPWKMVVTNQGDVPVRFAADGRLLTLEIPKAEDPYAPSTKKKAKAPPPVVCRLPAELRPTGVVEDRAVVLEPGARYEEVISPALYCFGDALAKALVPGATVTAKLGFPPRPAQAARKNAAPAPPFVVEPAVRNPTVSAVKELSSEPFVLPAAAPMGGPAAESQPNDDPRAPRIELLAPTHIDTLNELTVGMTLTVKNTGGRPATMNVRRDNLMFDVDGPSESAHCGQPAERRRVPQESFASLGPGATRTLDVWVGEMCSDVVFDRPGLYRVWPSLAFPNSTNPSTIKVWSETVSSKEPVLVRVREGRLPFYPSPPQVFGANR